MVRMNGSIRPFSTTSVQNITIGIQRKATSAPRAFYSSKGADRAAFRPTAEIIIVKPTMKTPRKFTNKSMSNYDLFAVEFMKTSKMNETTRSLGLALGL